MTLHNHKDTHKHTHTQLTCTLTPTYVIISLPVRHEFCRYAAKQQKLRARRAIYHITMEGW